MAVGFSNQEPYDQERRRAHGRYDYVVPHVLWGGVAAKLPNATLRIFQESGHQPLPPAMEN